MSVQKINVLVPRCAPFRPVPPGLRTPSPGCSAAIRVSPASSTGSRRLACAASADRAARREARAAGTDRRWPGATRSSQPEFAKDLMAAALADRRA